MLSYESDAADGGDVDLNQKIDDRVKRWYDRAVAAAEERVFTWTKDGDLDSYRRDQITLGGK